MKKYLITAIAAVSVAVTPVAAEVEPTEGQTPSRSEAIDTSVVEGESSVSDQAAIDATGEQLESARGGWYQLVIIGGALLIRYCSANRLTCARGALEIYGGLKAAQDAFGATKRLACRRGWIKKGC